jgi:hypothetical protein
MDRGKQLTNGQGADVCILTAPRPQRPIAPALRAFGQVVTGPLDFTDVSFPLHQRDW